MAIDWSKYGASGGSDSGGTEKGKTSVNFSKYAPVSNSDQHALDVAQSDAEQMAQASRVSDELNQPPTDPGAADSAFRKQQNPTAVNDWLDQNAVTRGLRDYVLEPIKYGVENSPRLFGLPGKLSDNPISNATAEYNVPDAPYLDQPGTNARQAFLDRSGQEAATGVPKFIGQTAAPFFVPGAGLGTGSAARGGAEALTSRLAPGLGQNIAREAAIGGTIGFGSEYAQGQGDLGQAAITGAAGAALGGALPLLGAGVRSASNAAGRSFAQATERPSLGSAVDDFIRRVNSSDTPTPTGRITQELPAPVYPRSEQLADQFRWNEEPTMARVETRSNPYAQKLDELFQAARQEQLPAGREREALDDLWSRMAGPEDPGLDQLIELATPTLRDMERTTPTKDMLSRARDQQYQREVAGAPLPVKSEYDRGIKFREDRLIGKRADQLNTQEPLAQSINETPVSKPAESGQNERGLYQTFKESPNMEPQTLSEVKNQGNTTYEQKTNVETVGNADQFIQQNGRDVAERIILGKSGALTDDETAAGFKLIQQAQQEKDFTRAADIANKLMTSGTENGRAVQINAIFNKLTPEGALSFAQKVAKDAGRDGLTADESKAITEVAQRLATTSQNKEVTTDAYKAIAKLAQGGALSDGERAALQRFSRLAGKAKKEQPAVDYTDLQGKPEEPLQSKLNERKKKGESFTQYSDRIAQESLDYIKQNTNRLSSNPADIWARMAIVGANKVFKGARSLADFTEQMADSIGREAYMKMDTMRSYVDSTLKFRKQNNIKTPEVESILNRAIGNNGISKEEAYQLRALAIDLGHTTGRNKEMAEAQLAQQFQMLTDSSIGDKLASVLRSAQLLNVRTTGRNIIGNLMFYAMENARRRVSAPIDLVTSKLTGQDREIFWSSAPNIWKDFFGDVGYGAKMAWQGLNPGGFKTQYDFGGSAFKRFPETGNVLKDWGHQAGSFMERSLGVINKSMDYASANMAMKNELYQLSKAQAFKELGKASKADLEARTTDIFNTADKDMLAAAHDYGEYMTFQDKNFLSTGAQKIKELLNAKQDFGLGNFIINYPKTPANILMRAIEYSPAGFLKNFGQLYNLATGKGMSKKDFINNAVRASMGSSLGLIGYIGAQYGLINTLQSNDKSMQSLERSAGKIPNSINIDGLIRTIQAMVGGDPKQAAKPQKGDYYASMDWAQPLSLPFSGGASAGQSQVPDRLNAKKGAPTAMLQAVEGAVNSVSNMSVLKNVTDIFKSNPSNPGVVGKLQDILSGVPAAFVASILGQTRNTMDPNVRDVNQGGFVEQTVAKLKNRLPIASETLPTRIDTMGKEMKNQFDNPARAVNSFANPAIMGQYDPSPAAKAVLDVIDKTGDTKLAPNAPQKSFQYNSKKVTLDQEQYQTLQKLKGQEFERLIGKKLDRLNDPNLADDKKKTIITDAETAAGEKARSGILKQYPKLKATR